jgi:biofilm PGA synthesis N-glycosyltransferase PgaC
LEINKIKYIIISPVRDEENHIEKTIQSVISQTIKPMKWVIVDDGSTDTTSEIIETYLPKNDWITLLKLPDRGYYDLMTGGEIRAFYKGFKTIKHLDYDFISKLDGDISFDEHYYEDLFNKFDSNKKLGIAGGAVYYSENDFLTLEKSYKKHVRGAARIYRRECWDDIGGAIDKLGWDSIDVYKARMLGWDTYSFEEIKMIHHVKTWTKGGSIHGHLRAGRMQHLIGTHPMFILLKAGRGIFQRPFLIRFFAFLAGYLKSHIKQEERVVDRDLMAYIRKDQLNRLLTKIRFKRSG